MSVKMRLVRKLVKRMGRGFFNGERIDPERIRAALTKAYSKHRVEKGVAMETSELGGVTIATFTPDLTLGEDIVYYVHGGGLITGDAFTAGPYASELALATGRRVVTCSYRLAPEHPYPAGLDDAFDVYTGLLQTNPGCRIALIGESGGAYLSLAIAIRARDEGIPIPASLVLNSVLADMSTRTKRQNSAEEITVTVESLKLLAQMYAPDADRTDPLVSPIYADFTDLPPLRIIYDLGEVLAVDSEAVARRATDAGVAVEVGAYRGTFHGFTTTGKNTPESKAELAESAAFMVRSFTE